jgi:hypothetical protein
LDARNGKKNIHRFAHFREKKTRDISMVKCMKDDDHKVLMKDKEIKERWGLILIGYLTKIKFKMWVTCNYECRD